MTNNEKFCKLSDIILSCENTSEFMQMVHDAIVKQFEPDTVTTEMLVIISRCRDELAVLEFQNNG